jgi:hypothetical protein
VNLVGAAFREYQRISDWIVSKIPRTVAWSLDDVASRARSGKQRVYKNAVATLGERPLCRKDTVVKGHCKREKVDPAAKFDPDPRMIMFRNPRFTVSFLRYVHPMEAKVFRMEGDGYEIPKGHMFAKYDNNRQRAEQIASKFLMLLPYGRVKVVKMDGSRFDMHLWRELQQEVELKSYSKLAGKQPDWNLIKQAVFFAQDTLVTKHGVKATGRFNRKSGEADTSYGNSIASVAMLIAFMHFVGIHEAHLWNFYDDGDDLALFLSEPIWWVVDHVTGFYQSLGLDMKIEGVAECIEKVIFCQAQPVFNGDHWIMVRNPWRVLSRGTTILYGGLNATNRLNHCWSTGMCELALGSGIPILQEYGLALIRNGEGGKMSREVELDFELKHVKLSNSRAVPISDQVRSSFQRAFDIDPVEQVRVEGVLRNWKFDPREERPGIVSRDIRYRVNQSF